MRTHEVSSTKSPRERSEHKGDLEITPPRRRNPKGKMWNASEHFVLSRYSDKKRTPH